MHVSCHCFRPWLFRGKPLPKPILTYCQLLTKEQFFVKFESKYKNFLSINCIWICLQYVSYFVQANQQYMKYTAKVSSWGGNGHLLHNNWFWNQPNLCGECHYIKHNEHQVDFCLQVWTEMDVINTVRLRQNGRHFADNIFRCIFVN